MRQGHNMMIKESSIQQAEITIINIYIPNAGAAKYIKQTLLDLKRQRNSYTIIVADFSTPLSSLEKSDISQQRHIKLH